MRPALPLLLVLASAVPAIAETGPSFDCTQANHDAEFAVCESEALSALDRELARLYRLAAEGPHMDAAGLEELTTFQRGWVKGRDDCWKAGDGLQACVRDAYGQRITELRAGYFDARQEDDKGISLGPLALDCPDLDYGISLTFLNGPEAYVTLQWYLNAATLPQTPSGSGAKYEGVAGEALMMLWTKGDEALFNPGQGPDISCKIDEIG